MSNNAEKKSPKQPKRPSYFASIYPGSNEPLSDALGATLNGLSKSLAMPLWAVIQDHGGPFAHLDNALVDAFHETKKDLPKGEPIALVIDSPGGFARDAYRLARLVRRRCGGFTALIPRAAWSAATLLSLGADRIIMEDDAHLGPLDAQVYDDDSEEFQSALDEVQALDRLNAHALESIDALTYFLLGRTTKKVGSVLPHALSFTAEMMRPLLEKIDVVHYNERARILRVAEDYGKRLLAYNYPEANDPHLPPPFNSASRIAARLVENYSEHGFPIDIEEARSIGLDVNDPTEEQASLLEDLSKEVEGQTAIGEIREVIDGNDA